MYKKNQTRQKLHAFKCEYLSFHTDKLETLRIYLYSSSPFLRAGKVFSKSEIWPKNLVRRPLIINNCKFQNNNNNNNNNNIEVNFLWSTGNVALDQQWPSPVCRDW